MPSPQRTPAHTIEVEPEHAGRRLDNYIINFLGNIPKSLIYRIIRRGEVRVNGSRANPGQRLRCGDQIRIPPLWLDDRADPVISKDRIAMLGDHILFEDDRLIILDKPSGIAVHAGTGLNYGVIDLVRALRPHGQRIELVHRLDRETSGCLLLAKDAATLRDVHRQLREGSVEKRYTALLQGRIGRGDTWIAERLRSVRDGSGERRSRVDANGRVAETRLQPLERLPGATLVAVQLLTGRTHQIRAHAAHIGHPVAGDRRYGDPGFNRALQAVGLRRLFLHATRITLQSPDGGAPLCVDAPMPDELNVVLEQLRTK